MTEHDQLVRYEAALLQIVERYGQVCDDFEECRHPACLASVGAWFVAYEALYTDLHTTRTPEEKEGLDRLLQEYRQ